MQASVQDAEDPRHDATAAANAASEHGLRAAELATSSAIVLAVQSLN